MSAKHILTFIIVNCIFRNQSGSEITKAKADSNYLSEEPNPDYNHWPEIILPITTQRYCTEPKGLKPDYDQDDDGYFNVLKPDETAGNHFESKYHQDVFFMPEDGQNGNLDSQYIDTLY